MEIIEDSHGAHELAVMMWDGMQRRPRTGIHVTDLIYCLTKAGWKMSGHVRRPTDDSIGRMGAGVGLESVLLSEERRHLSMELDGIQMTADVLDDGPHITEIKSTRISPNNLPFHAKTGELYYPMGWRKQIMAYLKGIAQLEMKLGVFFVIPATWKRWLLKFKPQEIDENWTQILGRRDVLMSHLERNWIPQPYRWRLWETECDGCEFAQLCAEWQANEDLGRLLEASIEQAQAVQEARRVLGS